MRLQGIRMAVCVSVAAVCCGGSLLAQTSGSFSPKDKMFLKEAAGGNMTEIDMAKIALDKSSNPDVKEFAQRMITDHTKLQENMKPYVEQAGVTPPTTLKPKDQMMAKKLSGLSGTAFDKQYIGVMVKDHHKDLAEFKAEVASTQNQELKNAVEQGEQVIQEHVNMIDGIAQKNGVSAPTSGGI